MTSGKLSLVDRLELRAESGDFSIRLKAWDKEALALAESGKISVTPISPSKRKGESNYIFDWSNAKVDMNNYSPQDPKLTRANRLWIMAYQAAHIKARKK